MKKFKFQILIMFLIVTACEKSTDGGVVSTPRVAIDCDTNNCKNASPGGSCSGSIVAIVQLTRSGCADASYDPVATGSVNVTCTASGCRGLIENWTNANNQPITEIIGGMTDICGHIDLNCDFNQDSGEPIEETSQKISSGLTITLDGWTDN